MKRILLISSMALLLTASWAPTADASLDQYRISHLTFSGAFALPGMVLPQGTYTFERLEPRIVRVLSQDHMRLYGTFMTQPIVRQGDTTKQEIVFGEVPAGQAPPIKVWYPFPVPEWRTFHTSVGYEFLY